MQRFRGQPLGPQPSIVVLGSAKLGNDVVLQPLLRGLRETHTNAEITYVGNRRTHELERLNRWVDRSLPLAEQGEGAVAALRSWADGKHIDLVINADGHSPHTLEWVRALRPVHVVGHASIPSGDHPRQRLAVDPDWARADLVDRSAAGPAATGRPWWVRWPAAASALRWIPVRCTSPRWGIQYKSC